MTSSSTTGADVNRSPGSLHGRGCAAGACQEPPVAAEAEVAAVPPAALSAGDGSLGVGKGRMAQPLDLARAALHSVMSTI